VRTESLLSRAIFKNVLGAFYSRWYVVVHPCSNFSIRRQMAPVQTVKFQTANFPIFCGRIIVIFCTTCIAREVFSFVIMGSVTHILLVLQWLEVVIAFVSSLFVFFENNALSRLPLWCVIELLPKDIASAFVGRFRWCLHRFFAEEKPFSACWTVLKIFARGRYDWCPNGRKNWKSEKMGAKFVRTTSTI